MLGEQKDSPPLRPLEDSMTIAETDPQDTEAMISFTNATTRK